MNTFSLVTSAYPHQGPHRAFLQHIAAAVLAAAVLFDSYAAGQDPDSRVPDRIEAKAFLVTDSAGYLWGMFGMDVQTESQPALFLNPGGNSGLTVALQDDPITPHQVVLDLKSGNQYLQFGNNDSWGSFLHLSDVAGNLRLGFSTRAQEALGGDAAGWGNEPWPVAFVRNQQGRLRSLLAATPKGGVCEIYDRDNVCVFRHGAGAPDVGGMPIMPPGSKPVAR